MSVGHRHTGVSHEHATPIERERAQRSEPPERSGPPEAPASERVGGSGVAKPPGSAAHEGSECATRAERGNGAPASEPVGESEG
jgi:hypothetical protein